MMGTAGAAARRGRGSTIWPDRLGLAPGLLAAVLAVLAIWPSAYLLGHALAGGGAQGWLGHYATTTLWAQAVVSIAVAAKASLVAFAVGAVPALVVARCDFPGRHLVTVLALLPLLFAPYVTAGTWTVAWSHAFFESRHALAIQHGLASSPYVFIVFRIAAARMPRAHGELAAALGLDAWQRWRRVHMPSHAVPVAASLMIVFAQAIGDYAAAERLGIETLSVGIHNLWLASQNAQVAAVLACVLIVPTTVLVLVAAWASTAIISQAPVAVTATHAGRRRLSAMAGSVMVGYSLLCSVLSFWIPEWLTVQWAWLKWERTRFAAIPGDMLNAGSTALATAALAATVCAITAIVMRSGALSRRAERLPWLFLLNYFLPPLVLALSFVVMSRDGSWAADRLGSWRDTRLLIVISEALRLLPFAMLPTLDALRRTPPALIEVARAFGRGPASARWVAFAAHLRPALLVGCALVFMESLKQLDLSLTLQPFGYSSPALKIYAFSRNQNMDRAAVWVLITQALMLVPMSWLVLRMRTLDERATG